MLAFGFGFKSSVLLVFFFHLLIVATILMIDGFRKSSRSNLWLGLLLILSSLYIAPFMFGYAGWYAKDGYRQFLFYVPFQQILFIGPVTFFYVKSLLFRELRLRRLDYIHFIPGLIYNIYIVAIFVLDVSIFEGNYFYADDKDKDLDLWYQVLGFLSMLGYFGLSLYTYVKYKRAIYAVVSYAEEIVFKWVGRFLIILVGLLILRLLFFVLNPEWAEFGSKFWYYAWYSIIFYFIAIYGYRHSIRTEVVINMPYVGDRSLSMEDNMEHAESDKKAPLEHLDVLKSQIDELMREKHLYVNSQLSLIDVSKEMNTNPRNVSQIINQGFDMNFNDFVNQYRTNLMVDKIKNQEHLQKTILSLAFECGFNSKSTFNRAFKKYTGKTPIQFIKNPS